MARLTLPEIHPHRGPNRHSHQPDGVPHTETQPPSRPHRPQQPDRTPHPSGDPPSPRAHPSPSTRRRHASSCPRSNRTRWPHRHAHPPLAHLTLPEIQPPSRPHRPHRPHRHQLTSSTVRLILPEIQPPGRPRRPHSTPTARIIPTEIQPNAGHPGTSSTARPLDGTPHPAGDPTAPRAHPSPSPRRRRALSRRRSNRPAGHAGRAAARRHASSCPRSNQPPSTPAPARPLNGTPHPAGDPTAQQATPATPATPAPAHQFDGTPHPAGDPTAKQATPAAAPRRHASSRPRSNQPQATPAQLTSSPARLILPEIHPPGRPRRPRSSPTARISPPEIQPTAGHTGRSSPTARLILPEIHPHRGPNRHSHQHAVTPHPAEIQPHPLASPARAPAADAPHPAGDPTAPLATPAPARPLDRSTARPTRPEIRALPTRSECIKTVRGDATFHRACQPAGPTPRHIPAADPANGRCGRGGFPKHFESLTECVRPRLERRGRAFLKQAITGRHSLDQPFFEGAFRDAAFHREKV